MEVRSSSSNLLTLFIQLNMDNGLGLCCGIIKSICNCLYGIIQPTTHGRGIIQDRIEFNENLFMRVNLH